MKKNFPRHLRLFVSTAIVLIAFQAALAQQDHAAKIQQVLATAHK